MLSVKVRQGTPQVLIQTRTFTLLHAPDNLMMKVRPMPRVSAALEAAPHKATGFYKQKLAIISIPIPELYHQSALLWFTEGQPSATGSLESQLLHFLARCEQ